MNHNLNIIKECKEIIYEFLTKRGLGLGDAETKIVHLKILFKNNKSGFEFLDFKIKHLGY